MGSVTKSTTMTSHSNGDSPSVPQFMKGAVVVKVSRHVRRPPPPACLLRVMRGIWD
jgi:hypothetical protein